MCSRAILFLAGDASGDLYTARLADELRARHPDWKLHALGGTHLARAIAPTGGVHIGDTSGCSAIGITSALALFWRGRRLSLQLRRFLREHRMDAAVLCDWGGFNCAHLRLFKHLRVPVLYYFPPRSWQRSGSPGLKIVPWVTRVATPFEWSAERLRAAGCDAEWVGHPLLESAVDPARRAALREEFGVSPGEKLIALLPGSRVPELKVLGPHLARTADLLRAGGGKRFVVATPASVAAEARRFFPEVRIAADRAAEVLLACDVAVVKTGTATLEAVVMGAPQVTVYDVEWIPHLEWWLLWIWKRIPFVAMPNIILQREVVREFLGLSCRAEKIATAVQDLLDNGARRERMLADYREVRRQLGENLEVSATQQTANLLDGMLAPSVSAPAEPAFSRPGLG